jgi:hypothetical protein
MDGYPFPGQARIDDVAGYQRAIDTLLESVKQELRIFDVDLRDLDFGSRRRSELIANFLLAGRGNRVRIVLHDSDHVERFSPRFMSLLQKFSHCLEIRLTPSELRQLSECYVLADSNAGVVRFHADQMRGKIFLGVPEEAKGWQGRFEELWNLAHAGVSATKLGL